MPRDKYAQALNTGTITQSANDVMAVLEVMLPNIPERGMVMAISKIDWGPFAMVSIAGSWHQMTLATRGDIAQGDLVASHPAVIACKEFQMRHVTTGSAIYEVMPNASHWAPEFLIAHRKIFLYVTSTLTAQINKARARIWFRFVKVSTEEFLQIFADYEG